LVNLNAQVITERRHAGERECLALFGWIVAGSQEQAAQAPAAAPAGRCVLERDKPERHTAGVTA